MSLESHIARIREANLDLLAVRTTLIALARVMLDDNANRVQIAEDLSQLEDKVGDINTKLAMALNCEEEEK